MKKITYILTFLSISYNIHAQPKLAVQEAINIALKNNFDIQIARNDIEINRMNYYAATGEALPNISITASDNEALNAVNQKLNTGSNISRTGAFSNSLGATLNASILLYNGYRIYATKNRLLTLQQQSEQALNAQIQNTIAAVLTQYYDIVRQQSYLQTILQSIEVARKRKEIIDVRKTAGLANNADIFQTQVDLNALQQDSSAQQLIIAQAKIDLLNLIKQKIDYNFTIRDTIIVDQTIQLDTIIKYLPTNPQLIIATQQIHINEWAEKEIEAQRYPSVSLNTGYGYNRNQNAAGLTLLNQVYGPFIGLNLQIPIFRGNTIKHQQQALEIATQNAQLQQQNILTNLQAATIKTWQAYKNTLQRLQVEKDNHTLTINLLQLVLQKFQLGQATIIDVREAQKSFEDAGYRLVNLAYAAKTAEIELKRLSNRIDF